MTRLAEPKPGKVDPRVPRLLVAGAHAKAKFRDMQIECRHYAYEHGTDKPEVANWKWPY